MLELVVLACLVADPSDCREHTLRLGEEGLSPAQCMYASIPLVSRWQTMHLHWRVAKWRCTYVPEGRNT